MLNKIRTHILNFLDNSKNLPWLIGLSAGLYPFLKNYNSNFTLKNSVQHFLVFVFLFLIVPVLLSYLIKIVTTKFHRLEKFQSLLLSLVNYNFFVLLAIITTWGLKKDYLIIGLVLATVLAYLFKNHIKKAVVFQLIMALLVVPKLIPNFYNQFLVKDDWSQLPDEILSVKFKETPNIYWIQPDGYVNQETLENTLYNSKSDLYDWLRDNRFKVYNGFRSNYPASLVSNTSIFAMKHHYFGGTPFSSIEMPGARTVINGNNSVIEILKNNGYANYFLVEDEYFQVNFADNKYDFQNIPKKDISFFSKGDDIKKEVFSDLENILNHGDDNQKPKFFFVEKVMPHHVHFEGSIEEEHQGYLNRLKQANQWLKKTINFIDAKDPNAIVIIMADHGGWVGIENYGDFYSATDSLHVNSIFSTLCAIKWNAIENAPFDDNLKTNVNLFRVLFSALSRNTSYLSHLEEDGSYQLRMDKVIGASVYQLIDENGSVVNKKID